MPVAVPIVIMRGGTSKALFVRALDLPSDPAWRDRLLLRIFGSPDPRQIDGLGGADPLTSKLAIISPAPSGRSDADITYTFGQVGIADAAIDYHSLCGNISSAVGAYAISAGLVAPTTPVTRVRVYNTNLERLLAIEVPVADGQPVEKGDYAVPGVPGTGARIDVDFADTAGAATGALLPTGAARDELVLPGGDRILVSLVDIGNAHVFVRAADVGLAGTESASQIDANTALRTRLEIIRSWAAVRMGMAKSADTATATTPATPILSIVSPPEDYVAALDGRSVSAADVDLLARAMFVQQAHKTYPGTSTVCTGVAAQLEGTLVHEVARRGNGPIVRIGHPAGVVETQSIVETAGNGFAVRRATLGRTARRLLDGSAFVPDDLI
ncbi:MAG TPA: PrpF domain-containing protein [Devosia sp.]|nr:PrpF domain-containing protein [Devosia sp.]